MPTWQETNFDGLVGPTHQYAGLSPGNLASIRHAGSIGNPRAAALQGLEKMRFVASLGVSQAVLPPAARPDLATLRRLGFTGTDAAVVAQALRIDPGLLRLCSSASSMWTANAATVAPSSDTQDGRLHLVVANLTSMFHRSLEATHTERVLRTIFADAQHFEVHAPLPGAQHFSDEGAANHSRFESAGGTLHLFGWGRESFGAVAGPKRHPARQTLEASRAVARSCQLPDTVSLFWQQSPEGIDAGAFHSDVLAVAHRNFFMLHELAFVETGKLMDELRRRLGGDLVCSLARADELPVADAVAAYPFNSQIVSLPSGDLAIVAPKEAQQNASAARFLERVVSENNPVSAVHYIDVNASMNNGGGPACLRLRVAMNAEERHALSGRVLLDDALHAELRRWVERFYRDRVDVADLADPELLDEVHTALDELTRLLGLGSLYDFQRSGAAQGGQR